MEALSRQCKNSFLVFRHNKYQTIPIDTVAFFRLKFECCVMACFDRQEYTIDYSLDQIFHLLPEDRFFRLNRQFLVNFSAIKDVEHYFSRRLLVNLVVPLPETLVVSREKATSFLRWLENR